MSDKVKYPQALALEVAHGLIDLLRPYCEPGFLCFAGSLRRGKAEVGDVEICYVSKLGRLHKPGDLFDSPCLLAEEFIQHLMAGKLAQRPNETGHFTWGTWNKLAIHQATGIPVDLFRDTKENWWRTLVIRTGPKELNIRLIQSAKERGLNVHAYGQAITRIGTGEAVPCGSEREFFELCGVEYLEPEERNM